MELLRGVGFYDRSMSQYDSVAGLRRKAGSVMPGSFVGLWLGNDVANVQLTVSFRPTDENMDQLFC
jgi:hypothetical protein